MSNIKLSLIISWFNFNLNIVIGFMIYWHVKKYDELVSQKDKADAFLADEEVKID